MIKKTTKIIKTEIDPSSEKNDDNRLIHKIRSRHNPGTLVYVQHGKHSQKKLKPRDIRK